MLSFLGAFDHRTRMEQILIGIGVVRKFQKGLRVLREPGFRRALRCGVAASIEHDGTPVPSGIRHVIDVGANRGQFLTWASVRFPSARFDCFEPIPSSVRKLRQVSPEGRTVEIHGFALGEHRGSERLFVTASDDSSSLLEPTLLQTSEFPGSRVVEEIQVEIVRLDQMLDAESINRPALLKIDVQGAELQVLRGAEGCLSAIDYVLVECSFVELYRGQSLAEEIVEQLELHDFSLVGFFSETFNAAGRKIQADALFERRNSSREH